MTTREMRGSTVLALIAMLLGPGSSLAQAAGAQKDEARSAMREGNTLLEHGHPEEALAKFSEAFRLFPSPKLHYNMGQAHSQLPGHEAEAYRELSRFLTEAQDATPSLRAAAEMQRGQLRSKVGLLTIAADPPDADLIVDGASRDEATRESPLALSVGTHRISLSKGGAASPVESVTVVGGDSFSLRLRVPAPPVSQSGSAAPPPAAPDPDRGGASPVLVATPTDTSAEEKDRPVYRKAWFWVVVSGVVVAAAVGGFFLLRPSATNPTPTLGSFQAD